MTSRPSPPSLSIRLRRSTVLSGAAAGLFFAVPATTPSAYANPEDGRVVAGTAQISRTAPGRLDVTQTGDRAVIDWRSFSVAEGEHAHFQQPSPAAIILNRVTGGQTSEIMGRLSATGQLWLVNPNGIVFGRNAQVDVAGLLAATADISNADFMAGRFKFQDRADADAMVINHGSITVAEAGLAALVAPGVANHGVITARLGEAHLAAGTKFVVDLYGDQRINVVADAPVSKRPREKDGTPAQAAVTNSGKIYADGGRVRLTAAAAKGLLDRAVDMSGVVQARSVEERDGEIILSGGDAGTVRVSGALDASGRDRAQAKGGTVVVTGERVELTAGARVDVSGRRGGGAALIGGDAMGGRGTPERLAGFNIRPARKPVPPAKSTLIAAGAEIRADAAESGDGGKVVVWADGLTEFRGFISAEGAGRGANGGFIETSGKESLIFDGRVSVAAPLGKAGKGKAGNILLDPASVTISNTGGAIGTAAVSVAAIEAISAGTVTVTADDNITVADLSSGGDGQINLQSDVGLTLQVSSASDGVISFTNAANAIIAQGTGAIRLESGLLAAGAPNNTAGGLQNVGILQTASGGISLYGPDGVTLAGSLTTAGGAITIDADADQKGGGAFSTSQTITTAGGNLSVKSGSGGITLNGNISLGAGTLSLSSTNNDGTYTLGGQLSLTGNATFNQALTLANGAGVSTSGTLTFAGAVTFPSNAAVTLTANGYSFAGTLDGNGSALTFSPADGTKDARLAGTAAGGEIDLTGPLAQLTDFATVRYVNTAGSGRALFSDNLSLAALGANLEVRTTAAIDLGSNNVTVAAGKTLSLSSSNDLTLSGTLTAPGGLSMTASGLNITGSLATTGTVNLVPAAAATPIAVFGAGSTGDFVVSQALVNAFGTSPSEIVIGRADGTGAITVSAGSAATHLTLRNPGTGAGGIAVNGALTVGSNRLTLNSAGRVTQTAALTAGSLQLLGTGGTHTLTDAGNAVGTLAANTGSVDFVHAGALTIGTAGATTGATVTGDFSAAVAASGGTLTLAGGAAITTGGTGAATLSADAIDLSGTVAGGTGVVTLRPRNAGRTISLGSEVGTSLSLTDAELDEITAGTLRIGSSDAGAITVNAALTPAGATTLSLLSGGAISQSGAGAITVANLRVDAGGAVALSDNTNTVTNFAAATTNDDLAFRDDGGFVIGAVDGSNGLSVGTATATLTSTGTVTQTQAITAQGLALSGSGATWTLTNAANDADTLAGNTGTVSFTDADDLIIGTAGGVAGLTVNSTALTLNVGGALSQSAALTGVSRLTLTAGGAIDLDEDRVANTIATLGAVARGGAFSLADSAGGLTLDGAVGAAAATASVRTVGALTLTSNATVAASGAGDVVLAATSGEFTNSRGADAVSLGTGRFLIYSDTRDGATEGGLTGVREYTRSYAAHSPSSVTRSGNVFLYGNTPILTVTATDATRVYGDADPIFSVTYSGLLSGDDASLAYSGDPAFTAAAATAGAGTYALTPSAGGLTSPTGYGFSYVAGTLTVTKAPLTVSATAQSKVYGDADPTLGYSVSGLKLSDTSTAVLSGALSRDSGEDVNFYAVGQGTLALISGNYTLSFGNAEMTVTPAPLTVNAAAQTKVYGDNDPTLSYEVNGMKRGDAAASLLSGALSRASGENVGAYAVSQGSLGLSSGNYTLSFSGSSLTVTPAPLTVTAAAQSKVYGDFDPTLGYTASGLKFSDAASSVLSGTLSRAGGENVGAYAVSQGSLGLSSGNYTLSFSGSSLAVTPAPLTVAAADAARLYGADNPTFTATASGLKNGDTLSSLGGASFSTAATAASDVGRWAIAPSLNAGNYTVTALPGTLTISPAPLTITALDAARIRGGADPAFEARYEGFVLGQGAGVLGGALAFTSSAAAAAPVGSYVLTPSGHNSANYTLRYVSAALTITAPPLAPITPLPTTPLSTTAPVTTQTVDRSTTPPVVTTTVPPVAVAPTTTPSQTSGGVAPATLLGNLQDGKSPMTTQATQTAALTAAAASLNLPSGALNFSAGALAAFAAGQSLNQPSPALLLSPQVRAAAAALTAAAESGRISAALAALSALSITEQRAALMNMATAKLIGGLLDSDNPTDQAVGAILKDAASGTPGGYAKVKAAVTAAGVEPDALKTYLAMFQHVQREQKTEAWGEALGSLTDNPAASDVFAAPGGASRITTLEAPRFTAAGRLVVRGRIEGAASVREARINGRWVFVDDKGEFSLETPVAAGQNQIKLSVTDENGVVSERQITMEAPAATPPQTDAAPKGRKIALMIAADAYADPKIPPLNTPSGDVAAVGRELNERLGYEVRVIRNPTKAGIVEAMRDLGREIGESDQLMVYYAGHGYEVAQTGTGYWLPADAAADDPKNWVSNNDVARFLNRMPARQILVVSDSCYSGAFTKEQKVDAKTAPRDPARLLESRSVMAMSSGGDEPVADGETNSPFAGALLNRLRGLPGDSGGFELFTKVRDDVTAEVPQTPQYGVVKAAGYDEGGDFLVAVPPPRVN
jgi:filamentous hemagglutinin family protein